MFVDVTILKGNGLLCTFILPAVGTLHVGRSPERVEMIQRSEGYPGPPTKTSLRAHRGLRAMIRSVFQAPVIIEPIKMAQSEES